MTVSIGIILILCLSQLLVYLTKFLFRLVHIQPLFAATFTGIWS